MKAGQSAKFSVKIGGEPAPEVTWFHHDQQVKAGDAVSIETKPAQQTTLTIKSAKRSDCGKISLTVKNSVGEDKASCELTVLGTSSTDRMSD